MRWLATIAYAILAIGVIAGFAAVGWERDSRVTDACRDRNVTKAVVLHLVEEATKTRKPTDLTAFTSFADLDPATQAYLEQLNVALNAPPADGQSYLDRARVLLVQETC